MRVRNSYSLALLSGVLLLLSYPPFNLEFLAWFAFVPVLIAVYYETRAKRRGRLTQVAAICLTPTFLWLTSFAGMFVPMIAGWLLGVIVAFFVAEYVIESAHEYWASKQLPSDHLRHLPPQWQIFVMPILVTAGEFILMNIPLVMKIGGAVGFVSISRTQWLNPPILQVASFTGMYGVTFLIWLVNSAIAYGIIHYVAAKRISKQAVAVVLIFIAILVCGWVTLPVCTSGDTTVAIIQAKPETLEEQHVTELYLDLSEDCLKYEPEIILWSIWPKYDLWRRSQSVGPYAEEHVNFCQENDVYLADGWGNVVFPDGRTFNYDAPYHIIHLFDGLIPFEPDKILPELHGFETRFGKFGILGCMEGAYTVPTRKWVNDGALFLPIVSGEPPVIGALPQLHAGNAVYRAVEHRIYTGVCYRDHGLLVDPYGRIVKDIAPEQQIVVSKIAFPNERPFYSKYGDIFSYIILALTVLLIGYNQYLRRKSTHTFCKKCKAQIEKGTEICPECGNKQ